jgi:predicted  nucleic acid-binding Zn-ribbon protein
MWGRLRSEKQEYAMNLKQMPFWVFLFLLFPTLVSAQQATKADIQALELKMITTITEMDKRLTNQIADLDKRLTVLQTTVTEMDKRLTAQIQAIQTTINVLFWAIGALIALVLAVITLPQLLGYFQEKRAHIDFQKEIDELKQRLEQQQQEIESLKSRRVVTPS